jgi:hypothetical protein
MSRQREQIESRLQLAAKGLWFVAVLAGVVSLGARLVANAELRVRVDERREEHQRLAQGTAGLESDIRLKSARAEQVAKDIVEQTNRRSQVTLAMADVLARASALREERDRFEATRDEVRQHFKKLDDFYYRASQQTPGIQPR